MLDIIFARIKQGHRTIPYPTMTPNLPERYRGLPHLPSSNINSVEPICPVDAIKCNEDGLSLDLGQCVFCGRCAQYGVEFSNEHRMAARDRKTLTLNLEHPTLETITPLDNIMQRLLGRSFKLRQVSAGGCNACEADLNVLSTIGFDLGRFGIQFVASPRHADGLLITGPVTANMREALEKTYEAMTRPKIIIASGSCAISGGIYRSHPEAGEGVDAILPVDLYIPGCPPHPLTVLDGLLRLLGRIKS